MLPWILPPIVISAPKGDWRKRTRGEIKLTHKGALHQVNPAGSKPSKRASEQGIGKSHFTGFKNV